MILPFYCDQIIRNQMSYYHHIYKGSYMIKAKEEPLLQFLLRNFVKNHSLQPEEDHLLSTSNSENDDKEERNEKKMLIFNKNWNSTLRRFSLLSPLKSNKVYYLFGYSPINELSIQNPDYQESFIMNYFRNRVVLQVEVTRYAIVLQLSPFQTPTDQPSIQHLLEKYKAKGNLQFYELAQSIQQITQIYSQMTNFNIPEQKPQSYRQILRQLGDSMFTASFGSNKIAFSKALLTYLDYDVEQFAVDAIKYRTVNAELYSSMSYPVGIKYVLDCLKYVAELSMGKITYEEFLNTPKKRFKDYIVSKHNVKSYCDFCLALITPSDFLMKIQKVHHKTDDAGGMFVRNSKKMMAIENEKRKARQSQFPTLVKLQKNIPNFSFDRKNAGYIIVDEQNRPQYEHNIAKQHDL